MLSEDKSRSYRRCNVMLVAFVVAFLVCIGCAAPGVKRTFCAKLEGVVVRLETDRVAATLKVRCATRGCHLARVTLHDPYGREFPVQNLRTVVGADDDDGFTIGLGAWTIGGYGDFGPATGVGVGFPLGRRERYVITCGNFILPSPHIMLEDWAITCHTVLPNGDQVAFLFPLPAEPVPAILGEDAAKEGVTPQRAEGSPIDRIKELDRRKAILSRCLDHKPIVPNAEGLQKQIEMLAEQIGALEREHGE